MVECCFQILVLILRMFVERSIDWLSGWEKSIAVDRRSAFKMLLTIWWLMWISIELNLDLFYLFEPFLNLLSLNSPHHHTQAYLPFSFDLPPSRSQLSHPLKFKVNAELTDGNNASQAAHTWTNHQSTHGFHPARLCSWGLNHVTKMRKRTRRRGLPRRLIHRGTWQYV